LVDERRKLASFLKNFRRTESTLRSPSSLSTHTSSYEPLLEIVARTVSTEHPHLVTNERIVAKRPGPAVLIDVQQNALAGACGSVRLRRISERPFPLPPAARLRDSLRPEL